MHKEGAYLSSSVILKDERCHVGEWNDSKWVEHEEQPGVLVVQLECSIEYDDQDYWHVGCQNVADCIGSPVPKQTHTRDKLLVLELVLSLPEYE